jgi:hypothetical protein
MMINYFTKALLKKEADSLQLSWLENDRIEGISISEAKHLIASLKTTPQSLPDNIIFNLELVVDSFETTALIFDYLERTGHVLNYQKTIVPGNPYQVHYKCTFVLPYLPQDSGLEQTAATNITNHIIKMLGYVPLNYCLTF